MSPSRACPARPAAPTSRRGGLLPVLWLALAAVPGLAAAGPAEENGLRAEARFLDRCSRDGATSGATLNSCHRLMVRLQAQLGDAVFIELVDGASEGFGRVPDGGLATAAPTASTAR